MVDVKIFTIWISFAFCLGLISCTSSTFQTDSQGWVLMRYYISEEKGLRGIEPIDLGEDVQLVQEVFPGSIKELREAALESIDIEELPESIGTYQGAALTWELYSFDAQIKELGPFTVSLDVAMAEDDSASYFVGLVTLPEKYEENADKFQAVFYHTLYAFSPIE